MSRSVGQLASQSVNYLLPHTQLHVQVVGQG